jgi:hypothetical protein
VHAMPPWSPLCGDTLTWICNLRQFNKESETRRDVAV